MTTITTTSTTHIIMVPYKSIKNRRHVINKKYIKYLTFCDAGKTHDKAATEMGVHKSTITKCVKNMNYNRYLHW
jgi:hypothetical protein